MTSLSDLLQASVQAQITKKQAEELKLKANNLDVISSYASVQSGVPSTGIGWFGTYHFYVDWEGDGAASPVTDPWVYDGTYDDLTERFVGASIRRGLPGPDSWCAAPAQIEIQLENGDDLLTTDNTDSPVFDQLVSVVKKRCKMTVEVGATTYQLFEGWVREVAANPLSHGAKESTVVVDDLIGRMKSVPMISHMVENVDEVALTAQAMSFSQASYYGRAQYGASFYGHAGMPEIEPSYDTALDEFDYGGDLWRESDTSVLDAIGQIMKSCLGYFYVKVDGTPVYRNRQWRPLNATSEDWDALEHVYIDAIGVQDSNVFNEVIVLIRQRKEETVGTVWELEETPILSAGETKTYTASFTDPTTGAPCGVLNGITPVKGTDYTDNSNLEVNVAWRGADAFVRITNNSIGNITLTLMQLRGTPITRFAQLQFSDGSGVQPRKVRWYEAPCLTGTIEAQSYVEWLYLTMSYLSERVRQASIGVWSTDSLAEVCQIDVDTNLILEGTSVSHVNWVHHNITPGNHLVTVGVSPAILQEMWILGTSELGTDTYLGV